jgi:hemoglobin
MTESLYERLGKTEGIGRIVDDVMAAHLKNPIIKARYEAIEDIDHATKMAAEFFAAGSGGEQEFIAVVDDILWALDKHGMTDDTKKDVLAILYSLKNEIIRV